ncbi:MAG: hypothetical protein ABIA04_08810 [Pseudomonadota bacterium]
MLSTKQILATIFALVFMLAFISCDFLLGEGGFSSDDVEETGTGDGSNIDDTDFDTYTGKLSSSDDITELLSNDVNSELFQTVGAIPSIVSSVEGLVSAETTGDREFFKTLKDKDNPLTMFVNQIFNAVKNPNLKFQEYGDGDGDGDGDDDEGTSYPFTESGLPDCVDFTVEIADTANTPYLQEILDIENLRSEENWNAIVSTIEGLDEDLLFDELQYLLQGFTATLSFEGDDCSVDFQAFDMDEAIAIDFAGSVSWEFGITSDSTVPSVEIQNTFTFDSFMAGYTFTDVDEADECQAIQFFGDGELTASLNASQSDTGFEAIFQGSTGDSGIEMTLNCCYDDTCTTKDYMTETLTGKLYIKGRTDNEGDESLLDSFDLEDTPFSEDLLSSLELIKPSSDGDLKVDFDINFGFTVDIQDVSVDLELNLALIFLLSFDEDGPYQVVINEGGYGLKFDINEIDAAMESATDDYTIPFSILYADGQIECEIQATETLTEVECTFNGETFTAYSSS